MSRSSEPPPIGWIVDYILSDNDVTMITQRRTGAPDQPASHGNRVAAGQTYPMVITRVWDNGSVNGQVFLDGTDTYWATSATVGDDPGHFVWPS